MTLEEVSLKMVAQLNINTFRNENNKIIQKWILADEDTGKEKTIWWCDTKEFSGARKYATLIKYLLKVGGENGKE